jgi:hypothetical protein
MHRLQSLTKSGMLTHPTTGRPKSFWRLPKMAIGWSAYKRRTEGTEEPRDALREVHASQNYMGARSEMK